MKDKLFLASSLGLHHRFLCWRSVLLPGHTVSLPELETRLAKT
jgi:hypothetical protein